MAGVDGFAELLFARAKNCSVAHGILYLIGKDANPPKRGIEQLMVGQESYLLAVHANFSVSCSFGRRGLMRTR